ncbi:hypothetical protein DWB58_30695 [candidate division KSB1 bacterium]|nr:hypothetical protein [candidate division KSB1 bacterium]
MRHRFKIFHIGKMHGECCLLPDDERRIFHKQLSFFRPQRDGSSFMFVFGCGFIVAVAAEAKGKKE